MSSQRTHLVKTTLIVVCLCLAASSAWPMSYDLSDLGVLGSWYSYGNAINNLGQVVGYSNAGAGASYYAAGFLWDEANGMQDLGTLGGSCSCANDINDSGQVVGWSYTTSDQAWNARGFVWDTANGMQELGTLGGSGSWASGINNSGQVAGYSNTTDGHYRASLWDAGTILDLGTLGGPSSLAYDINDSTQVVGRGPTSDGINKNHAFLWQSGTMTDLGSTLGAPQSYATAINSTGQVVGYDSWGQAFLWESTTGMQNLVTVSGWSDSAAGGINDSGQVVGRSSVSSGDGVAWLWDSSNGAVDLNSLVTDSFGWHLVAANGINDLGQITGKMQWNGPSDVMPSRTTHAFLATPSADGASLTLSPYDITIQPGAEVWFTAIPSGIESPEYRWDWEGDGVWDTVWATANQAGHPYSEIGIYHPSVQARDPASNTWTAEGRVEVTPELATWVLLASTGAAGAALRRKRKE